MSGAPCEAKRPVMAWLAEYAALILNKYGVGCDRKTRTMSLEFGEAVLWKKPNGGPPSAS